MRRIYGCSICYLTEGKYVDVEVHLLTEVVAGVLLVAGGVLPADPSSHLLPTYGGDLLPSYSQAQQVSVSTV